MKISEHTLNDIVSVVDERLETSDINIDSHLLDELKTCLTNFLAGVCDVTIVGDGDTYNAAEKPLGLENALDACGDDDELKLFECEVGLFDYKNDPNTPFQTQKIVVACYTQEDVAESACLLAEESILVVSGVIFELIGTPEEINANDY